MKCPVTADVRGRRPALALALRAAGIVLVLVQAAAQAGIVHVTPPQPVFYSDALGSTSIDINSDGVPDFILSGGMWIALAPLNNNGILSVPEPPPDWGALIYALPANVPICSPLTPPLVWWDASGRPAGKLPGLCADGPRGPHCAVVSGAALAQEQLPDPPGLPDRLERRPQRAGHRGSGRGRGDPAVDERGPGIHLGLGRDAAALPGDSWSVTYWLCCLSLIPRLRSPPKWSILAPLTQSQWNSS